MSFPQQPVHTRIEFDVEPEPELVSMGHGLSLTAAWDPERRQNFFDHYLEGRGVTKWFIPDPRLAVTIRYPTVFIPMNGEVRIIENLTLIEMGPDSK